MDFTRADGFYSAPFPSDSLRGDDGKISLAGFPNPYQVDMLGQGLALIERDARGFAQTGGVFFALTGALDASRLPTIEASTQPDSTIFLLDVAQLKKHPVTITFREDGGPLGAANLLALLPVQGIPLRASATYAAVVLRSALDASGQRLHASPTVEKLASGASVPGLASSTTHASALAAIQQLGIAPSEIAGFTAFTTDDPVSRMRRAREDVLSTEIPAPESNFVKTDTFDTFCVYASTVQMPVYQQGEPPFQTVGGDWAVDASGHLVLQGLEQSRIFVTVPRREMPAAGYPTVVFIRTGGGGDRPLIDRGPRATNGGPSIEPGKGPAFHFAQAGFAGVSIDGPHGGLRNVSGRDEQFTTFNVFNPAALRDNVRQSALEIILLAHMLGGIAIDASDCPGASPVVRLDDGKLALMGHSMGASIAPLVSALEPKFRTILLSGAGASWIENVMYKQKPLVVKPALELFFNYEPEGLELTHTDPTLTIVQWAAEDADAQVYARHIVREVLDGESPRNVLMMQGIVDHYIMPTIANALSASLGLDLAGTPLDATHPELMQLMTAETLLAMVGRSRIPLPTSSTAVLVQHPADAIEDGHETVFQTEPPKYQYRCFLASFAGGAPMVPSTEDLGAPCPQ